MPKQGTKLLSDTTIKAAKPKEKTYMLRDGGGLWLVVEPSGRRWWKLRVVFNKKENSFSIGDYLATSLARAREEQETIKRQIAAGIDPGLSRKLRNQDQSDNTFKAIAMEWLAKQKTAWEERHAQTIEGRLQNHIFPHIGAASMQEINAPSLLSMLRQIEARGNFETVRRVNQICGQVFRYAIATGRADRNPAADLRGALTPPKSRHMASLTNPNDIAGLLRAIDTYRGSFVTLCALKLAPLLFVRPGELRHAEWSEIDLDRAEWRIPAEKMKMKNPHIVPLSSQAVDLFLELKPITGQDRYIFPSERSKARPMSNNTVNAALRRMGFTKDEMTGHGFRSIASTLLNEQGWNRDAIERQLAHAERNKVRAAYNFAEFLPERRKMMQGWADYLGTLKAGHMML
ncbi:MAG: tyrosine-type recombinase/integrase [Desulfobulbaceae bacterium]|nr:tyrosine-type recombinase/integrase [Desulfobulbaceae bacterium]